MIGETDAAVNAKREYTEFVRFSKGPQQKTTSNHIRFEENPASLSVSGLTGCTSIIVISRRGAWASHIWERVFSDGLNAEEMSINRVHRGEGTDSLIHPFGIDDLRNKPREGARGVMFGDNSDLADAPDLHVFIVTPRPRVPQYIDIPPDHRFYTEDEYRDNPIANAHLPPLYPNNIRQIRSDLRFTLGAHVPIQVISYAPRVMTQAQAMELDNPDLTEGRRREVMGNIAIRMFDPENQSSRGKVLIQYRPASDCNDKARWRIWVEDRDVQAEAEWKPETDQLFVEYEDQEMKEKRMKEGPEGKKGSEGKMGPKGKKGPKACPVKPGDGDGKSASKGTLKPTATRRGDTTSAATLSNPSLKCTKDADCNGPDQRCNSGKKGVCNKHKRFQCQKPPKTTKPASKTTTKELKTRTKAPKTKTKVSKPTTKGFKTTISLSKPTTAAPGPKSDSPRKPLERGPQRCNDEDDFPGHSDVHGTDVYWGAQNVCNNEEKALGPGDKFERNEIGFYKRSNLKFRVTWIGDCTTEEDKQAINVPSPPNQSGTPLCVQLFYENYGKCE